MVGNTRIRTLFAAAAAAAVAASLLYADRQRRRARRVRPVVRAAGVDMELLAAFQRATLRVSSQGASLGEEAQLALYGLFKQATCGPCAAPPPSLLHFTARTKWCAPTPAAVWRLAHACPGTAGARWAPWLRRRRWRGT